MKESKYLQTAKHFLVKTTLFMMLLTSAFAYSRPADAAVLINKKQKVKVDVRLSKIERRKRNLNRFYAVCTNIGKVMAAKHFTYSNGGVAKSFKTALAKGKRHCNCARYVNWCLQEYGAISRGKTFYAVDGGGIHKSFKHWGNKVKIIRVYKSPKRAHLKEGDVCFWDGVPHLCIYAGKNAKGKTMWFDGGKVATRSNSEGSRYKKYGRRHLGYLDHRTVSYVIRIKDLQ